MVNTIKAIEREIQKTPDKLILYEDFFECIKILAKTDKELAYPLISCGIGILAGAAMYLILPEFIGATSMMVAIISGAVSGLAATGSNQVLKQLMKSAEEGTLTVDTTSTPDSEATDKQ